jgi:copper chaperone NosL
MRRRAAVPGAGASALAALVPLALALAAVACTSGPPQPVAIDPINDQCAACRMVISDPGFAAEIVAPGEEPRLFDDLRCLRDGLAAAPPAPDARIFVADRRTGAWIAAGAAIFVSVPDLATPMASHWVAYADEASRLSDPYAAGGAPVAAIEVLGAHAGGGRAGGAPEVRP